MIDAMIKKRLGNSGSFDGEDTFMHVCTILPYRTLSNVENKQYPKRNCGYEFVA
jgi:hypothetical protein